MRYPGLSDSVLRWLAHYPQGDNSILPAGISIYVRKSWLFVERRVFSVPGQMLIWALIETIEKFNKKILSKFGVFCVFPN